MHRVLLAATLVVAFPATSAAQVEIGLDGAVGIYDYDESDDNVTIVRIPEPLLRLGFPVGERVVLEPLVAFASISSGGSTSTQVQFVPGVAILFSDEGRPRFYLRGEVGVIRVGGSGDSATQTGVGGAAGIRIPMRDNAIFRLEAAIDKWGKNEDAFVPGYVAVRFATGFSAVVH